MTWTVGTQKKHPVLNSNINQEILAKEGFLEDKESKVLLYEFLRNNLTFSVDLISGIKLFPFQHMAIKAMFEADYFLGIWSRGMSKSFTTGIYANMDAILNQGIEIGILSKSFRWCNSSLNFRIFLHKASNPTSYF